MVAHQLDLFGGPLKPPKKITVDDDVPVEEVQHPGNETQTEAAETTHDQLAVASDESIIQTDVLLDQKQEDEEQFDPSESSFDGSGSEIETDPSGGELAVDEPLPVEPDQALPDDEHANTATEKVEENPPEAASQEVENLPGADGDQTDFVVDEPEAGEVETSAAETTEPADATAIAGGQEELPGNSREEEDGEERESSRAAMEEPETDPETEERAESPENNPDVNDDYIVADESKEVPNAVTIVMPDDNDVAGEATGDETAHDSADERNANIHAEEPDILNVPPDEQLFKRQYYSMRETAAMFGVNQSLLRFWENEFDILQPKKNKKGDRYFRPIDVKNLVLIYHLLRVRKFTMDGAKEYLQANKKAGDSFELIRKLEKLKSFLLELKAGL